MLTMGLGIVATAGSMMFSHYFSGTGRPHHNMIGSAIGLVFTLVPGLIFIPRYGLLAAGLIASISYIMNMTYLMVVFIKMTGARASDFMIGIKDVRFVFNEMKKLKANV
jgi:O-antigen/teichoic acid export membrane protein